MTNTLDKKTAPETDLDKRLRDAANDILHKIQGKIFFASIFDNEDGERELWLFINDGKPRMKPLILCSGDCASESMLKFRTAVFLERTFGQYSKFYSYQMVQALFNHYCEIAESYSGQRFMLIDNSGVK